MRFNEWVEKYAGKRIDIDGAYGVQCVDLIKHYILKVIGVTPQAIGNAIEYWSKRNGAYISGLFTPYTFDKGFAFKQGDIIVMRGSGAAGHIAVCNGDYNKNGVYAYDENYLGKGEGMTLRYFAYDGHYKIVGVLRGKDEAMSKKYFGVDISEHNGTVDWSKVAKNVDFAILRIGRIGNTQNKMDVKFEENYAAAKKAGVKLGAYVYIYSKSTKAAKAGAEWILKQIKGKDFDMPIYCDMEDSTIAGLGKTTLTAITDAFNEVIRKGGYRVGIYANLDWFKNKLNASVKQYYTWIAHYTSGTDKYKGEYQMWQNSSKGKVNGIKGNVDTNYLYEDIFNKPATTQPVKPTPTAPSVPTYKVGNTYTLQKDLNVRKGAGTDYAQKKRSELTADGKKHAKLGIYAVLKKGTRVTCKATKKVGSDVWIQTPSGWLAAYYKGNKYIK